MTSNLATVIERLFSSRVSLPTYQILVVDADAAARRAAADALIALGHVVVAETPADAISLIDDPRFDLVIAGIEPATQSPPVLASPRAMTCVPGPLTADVAIAAVTDVHERAVLLSEGAEARDWLASAPSEIVARSPVMLRVLEQIAAVAESDAPVLLTGETGTGKDLLARRIHELSSRTGLLVALNCAAIPDTLLEAELFGYERGAFTGALARRDGRFKAADGGTLFLDEINGLSLPAQAKLLRVLQDGTFEPLGSNVTLHATVRLIAATNEPLKPLVAARSFREDLYYRINVLDILVPPLRARTGDLVLLVHHFLSLHAGRGREPPTLSPRAWAALKHHAFPGNVRELDHALQRALVLSHRSELDLEHFPAEIVATAVPHRQPGADDAGADVIPLATAVRDFEDEYVQRVVERAGGNRTRAARWLGISRKNLWHKLGKNRAPRAPKVNP